MEKRLGSLDDIRQEEGGMNTKKQPFGLPAIRQLVRDESDEKVYRVVLAGGTAPDVVLCHIYGGELKIMHVPVAEFQRRAVSGYQGNDRFVWIEQDPFDAFKQMTRVTSGHVLKSQENWNRIEALVSHPALFRKTLYPGVARRLIFEQHAKAQGVCVQVIRRLHRWYLQRGMTPLAVSSNLWRSGRAEQPPRFRDDSDVNSEIRKRQFSARPGRRPPDTRRYALPSELLDRLLSQYVDIYLTSREGPWDVDVPDELMKQIGVTVLNATFPSRRTARKKSRPEGISSKRGRRWPRAAPKRQGRRRRRTMQNMVDHLNYVCRCVREVRDVTGQIIELELAPFEEVTLRQFQHYWMTRVPVSVRKRRAMGERTYELTGRPIQGHALQHSVGPGAEFMIDATIADIYLVSRVSRIVVVGRPTVYLVMDVWSRMIVGVLATFDPPSFDAVALVLENIVTPKDELCARYGLAIEQQQWPCQCLPSVGFVTDRGSDYMKVDAWRAVARSLHLSISNVKVRDPLMRALIERRFGVIPLHFQPASFGVVEKDAAIRGAPRYAWDATHTLGEFTKKLLRAILVYNQMPIGREGAEPDMVFQGMADTPLNRWNWGMENRTGSLRKHSLDEVRMATWPHDTATPKGKGLDWNGVYYTSPYIESTLVHCWGRRGRDPVPIQFNPGNISQIILLGKDHPEYGYQARTNRVMPGDTTLMEWEIQKMLSRANARQQMEAMQPQRVMENLNNGQESRMARQEQREALARAGLDHPETVGMRAAREREMGRKQAVPVPASTANVHDSGRAEAEIAARHRHNTLDLLGD